MPRWLRVIRAMVGTGLTFAVGVGGAATVFGAIVSLRGGVRAVDVLRMAGRLSVASFLLGLAFSGALALVARSRFFKKVSLGLGTALGAGAGLLYWLFLAMTGGRTWEPRVALLNFVLLIVMGSGAALGTLWIARRAGGALTPGDGAPGLGAGEEEIVVAPSRAKDEVPKP